MSVSRDTRRLVTYVPVGQAEEIARRALVDGRTVSAQLAALITEALGALVAPPSMPRPTEAVLLPPPPVEPPPRCHDRCSRPRPRRSHGRHRCGQPPPPPAAGGSVSRSVAQPHTAGSRGCLREGLSELVRFTSALGGYALRAPRIEPGHGCRLRKNGMRYRWSAEPGGEHLSLPITLFVLDIEAIPLL